MRRISLLVLLAAMAACKKGGGETPGEVGSAPSTIALTSTAFSAGGTIPKSFTCEGNDKSVDLSWTGAPKETKSFVLIVDDPDAPTGTFTHWVLFDLPGTTLALPPAASVGTAGKNDFDKSGFSGPCPPKGKGVHRYFFKLFAIDIATLGKSEGATREEVEAAMKGHILARGELMGTFGRD